MYVSNVNDVMCTAVSDATGYGAASAGATFP